MLVGGTGITPMIQALHAVLGTAGDDTTVRMIYGNKTQNDILCKDLLDKWAADFGDRFRVIHVLSRATGDATWTGAKGHITRELIEENCAPPMYTALCGPRDQPDVVTGTLADMGFTADMVF